MLASLPRLLPVCIVFGTSLFAAEPAPSSLRLAVAPVVAAETPVLTAVNGTVRPARRALLAPKVMGTVADLSVTLGQTVRAGDVLVRISAAEIDARVAQARTQLGAARRDLARERTLLPQGASTADLVRNLEDRTALAEAGLREAETMLGYTELRAPFAGTVARKFAETGDLAAPGHPLLELEGGDGFQIEAGIPDSLVARLAPGQTVAAESTAAFTVTVAEISSAADPSARTVTVKFAAPAGAPVRSGQFVRLLLPAGSAATLHIPASAVSAVGQLERVFVVVQGRTVLRLVKTGARTGDRIEILAGLDAGESVVVAPPAGLREGQSVAAQS